MAMTEDVVLQVCVLEFIILSGAIIFRGLPMLQ
jgi:hypothetical protein